MFADYADALSQNYGLVARSSRNLASVGGSPAPPPIRNPIPRRWTSRSSSTRCSSTSRRPAASPTGSRPRPIARPRPCSRRSPDPISTISTIQPVQPLRPNPAPLPKRSHDQPQADLQGNFAEWRFPVEFRAGGGLYRIARRKAAGQIVLDFRGIDGIAASGDEILNASQFSDTTYGDQFLYGIKTPPLLDPYKTGEYIRQNPLAFQNIQPTNVQRQAVNSQNITEDIPNAYAAFTAKLSSRLTFARRPSL